MMIRGALVTICFALVLFVAAGFGGCDKKRSEAIVIDKEHIDAAEIVPSPSPEPSVETPKESPDKSPSPDEPDYQEAPPLAPDEVVVSGRVVKKEVLGTSKDPRATKDEQWRVTVDIPAAKQSHTIQTDRAHYDRVKVGDRIKVRYRVGQFTGVVWYADIED
jgi:hypothetical protein